MTDREKVVRGLEHCTAWAGLHECQPKFGPDCPYEDDADCKLALMRDALALLKEKEAVTEYVIDEFQPTCKACGFRPFAGYIPSLEWMRERGFRFCPQCGQKVKWNEK